MVYEIKKLEWENRGGEIIAWAGENLYSVGMINDKWAVAISNDGSSSTTWTSFGHETIQEAKSRAQLHFESRLKSCLVPWEKEEGMLAEILATRSYVQKQAEIIAEFKAAIKDKDALIQDLYNKSKNTAPF